MSNTDTDPTNDLAYRPQPDQPSPQTNDLVQRQTDLPPQTNDLVQRPPRALPPAIGNFLGNIGAFVPRNLSPPPSQGMPPPTWPPTFRENRRQMYVPSQANRPVTDLGKPPRFPQMPDMWQVPGVYEGVGRQLGRWGGPQRTRLMAGNLSRFTNAYMQGTQRGQREYARIQHQRMTEAADALQGMLQSDLQNYGSAYNTYGSDPQQLQSDLMNRATQLGDTEMQAAINLGPREAERMLQWRQAKLDDLNRSNTARRQHDEDLRTRNPFMINPVGPDGTPTARLPKPFDTTPQRMTKDNIQLAGAFPRPDLRVQGVENRPSPDELRDVGPLRPPQPSLDRWPDLPPDAQEGNDSDYPTRQPDPEGFPMGPQEPLDPRGRDIPRPLETTPPEGQRGEQTAQRQGRVQLAQADTGTMTDAPTLPQITVRPGDEDQSEEDQNGRTVWDDVRLRSQLREARQGGAGGGPGGQPPSAAGAQPPQPSPAGQPPGAAGQREQGQPTPAAAQTADQGVPPQAAAPAQTAPPAAGGQRPLTMTPALTQAQQEGLMPEEINNLAQRHFTGHMTAGQFKSLDKQTQRAISRREAEMQGALTGILQTSATGDAVFGEVEKISPSLAADMRAVKAGVAPPPKNDPSGLFRSLMFKADPTFTDATYQNRNKALTNYTSGPASRNLTSAGTAIRHADRLLHNLENAPSAVKEALYKGLPLAVISRMPEFTGMPNAVRIMQEMEADRDALGSEFATALASAGGTGRGATGLERGEQAKRIDLYAPRAAIDRVREMKELIYARVEQLKKQFEADTGMSFNTIKGKFDIPGIDQTGQQGGQQGDVIDFRDIK